MTPHHLILAAALLLPVAAHADCDPRHAIACFAGVPNAQIVPPSESNPYLCPAVTGCPGISISGPTPPPPLSPDARAMAGRVGAAVAREMAEARDPAARAMLGRVLDAVAP